MKPPYKKPFAKVKPITPYSRLLARILTVQLDSPAIKKKIDAEIMEKMFSYKERNQKR